VREREITVPPSRRALAGSSVDHEESSEPKQFEWSEAAPWEPTRGNIETFGIGTSRISGGSVRFKRKMPAAKDAAVLITREYNPLLPYETCVFSLI